MEKQWLSFELDQKPYFVQKDIISKAIDVLDQKKLIIENYCARHPDFKEIIDGKNNNEARKRRSRESAQSYLGLETAENINAVSWYDLNEEQRKEDRAQIIRVLCYADACDYMNSVLASNDPYLSRDVCIKAHCRMCEGEEAREYLMKPRFRDASDTTIVMHGDPYFTPVDGELVDLRMNYLFGMYNTQWYNDHPIVKAAKFASEYYRIQPHVDGNKRTALMCLNFILQGGGYTDIYFNKQHRGELFDGFKTSILTRDVTEFALSICKRIEERLDEMLFELRDFRIKLRQDNPELLEKEIDEESSKKDK